MKLVQPTYITKLPSNGKEVKFRPFVVKEERNLLLAKQEEDPKVIIEAMKELIRSCTYEVVDPDQIPYYDFEHLFLMIRAKSVGEVVELIGGCGCDPKAKTPFSVDIEESYVEGLDKSSTIELVDSEYSIKIKHPSIDYFVDEFESDKDAFEILSKSIDSIFTKDEVYEFNDSEKAEFIESMNPKQQRQFSDSLNSMPSLKIIGKYSCKSCGKSHEVNVTGVQNFFV